MSRYPSDASCSLIRVWTASSSPQTLLGPPQMGSILHLSKCILTLVDKLMAMDNFISRQVGDCLGLCFWARLLQYCHMHPLSSVCVRLPVVSIQLRTRDKVSELLYRQQQLRYLGLGNSARWIKV